MSGAYEDDFDKADEIIYTGEGGNNLLGNGHQKTEQTLLRGNLALKVTSRGSFDFYIVQKPILLFQFFILSCMYNL